ncbi:MAG: type IV secretion system protein [Pseudomonadota bacterium]
MLESILNATDAAIDTFVFDAWTSFNNVGNDWVTALMVLFVIVQGYALLIGRLSPTLPELFPRILKFVFIYVLVTNVALLMRFVFALFTDVPEAMATSLLESATAETAGINGAVGEIYDRGLQSAALLWNNGGLTNVGPIFLAGVVWLVTLLTVGYVTFLLMLAKLSVAVLLSVAPFFILLYLFDSTRRIFEGWLRQLLSFALIPIFTYALLLLIVSILDQASLPLITAANAGTASLTQIAPYALVMAAAFLLAQQILGWAAGVAGGFSLSTLGAYGTVATGAAIYAQRGVSRAASSVAQRVRGKTQPESQSADAAATPLRQRTSFSQNDWASRQVREQSRPS